MQKAIKIAESNAAAIESALKEVNGKSTSHTYTGYGEIFEIAAGAECRLERLGVAKARRAGAVMHATSGEKVANSYKNTRTGTLVLMERRSSDWYLVSVSAKTLFGDGGSTTLHMTKAQDEEAVANFRKQYVVAV